MSNDYISRIDLGIGKCNPDVFEDKGYAEGWNAVVEIIEAAPPADVRPVVLCKDCIHRPYSSEPGKTSGFAVESPDRKCKCPCFNPDDGYYSWIPADDFFCADGERRSADMRPAPEPTAEKPAAICQTCGNFETCPWQNDGNMTEYIRNTEGRVVACSDYKDKKG